MLRFLLDSPCPGRAAGHATVYERLDLEERLLKLRRKWHLLWVEPSVCQHPFQQLPPDPVPEMCWSYPVWGCWDWFVSWEQRGRGCCFICDVLTVFLDPKISITCGKLPLRICTLFFFFFFTILILVLSYPSLGLLICFTSRSKYFLLLYDVGFF